MRSNHEYNVLPLAIFCTLIACLQIVKNKCVFRKRYSVNPGKIAKRSGESPPGILFWPDIQNLTKVLSKTPKLLTWGVSSSVELVTVNHAREVQLFHTPPLPERQSILR